MRRNRTIVQCKICATPFECKVSEAPHRATCSRPCALKYRSVVHRGRRHSTEWCANISAAHKRRERRLSPLRLGVYLACGQCGDHYLLMERHRQLVSRFCSRACARKADRNRVSVNCAHCASPLIRALSKAKRSARFFCNPRCRYAYQIGPAHPVWNGGPLTLERRLATTMRNRLRSCLRRKNITESAAATVQAALGCSVDALRRHLEEQFPPGMTWDNWSKYGWHIDHIRPLAAFDLTDPFQLAAACHFSNLQPLWAIDNIKKGCRIDGKRGMRADRQADIDVAIL